MGVEKDSSKGGGGYVGGFFQLFDWTAKSRKKLFSSKSDFSELSKQGKRSEGNLPATQLHLVDEEDAGVAVSVKGGSDYSCASSMTDDDGYGARAPGVVARLMGLDSLPMSSYSEQPYSTPFSDTRSLQEARLCKKNAGVYHEHDFLYSGYLLHKVEGPVRNFAESKPQRTPSKPIEKFQTEMLPPRSAKSIPITHHKLLSPIKSPAFIPSKNAAHIMEAAARILESGTQVMPPKAKMSHVGSSSVPLKLRDLKEKVESSQKMGPGGSSSVALRVKDMKEKIEASSKTSRHGEMSRRQVETDAVKSLKGQSLNKSWNGPVDTTPLKASNTEDGCGVKTKGRSISLAIQAKVNVQRREGLSSNSSTGQTMDDQKEWIASNSTQPFRSQPSTQKNGHKKPSTHSASGVLRQNNQKQNCVPGKDRTSSKSSVSSLQSRKVLSSDPSPSGRTKTSNRTPGNSKTGSRKFGVDATDGEKGNSYLETKSSPRKKRLIDGGFRFERNHQVIDNVFTDNKPKAVQPKPNFRRVEDSTKSGSDVISFTFTTPLTRSTPSPETSSQVEQKDNNPFMDNRGKRLSLGTDCLKLPSFGHNVIGGDALSKLLEQKLKELSYVVENSRQDSVKKGSTSLSESSSLGLTPALSPAFTALRHEKEDEYVPFTEKLEGSLYSQFSSANPSPLQWKQSFQGAEEMDECSSSRVDTRKLLDRRQPSPVSILEPAFSTESCNSSESTDSSGIDGGSKACSSVQAQEVLGLTSTKKLQSIEADMDLLDSASSTSTATLMRKDRNRTTERLKNGRTRNWELEYMQQILCNLEQMFNDFALGRSERVIDSHLFDRLENQITGLGADRTEPRLNRKLLFDCFSECLDVRYRQYASGGFRGWTKCAATVKREERLAEEAYREISDWRGMGDCMVDELVDKDMSNQYGSWLDFEIDAYAVGEEIEAQILDSLVQEAMVDFLKM